jgi:hypothetical protein
MQRTRLIEALGREWRGIHRRLMRRPTGADKSGVETCGCPRAFGSSTWR